MKKVAVVKCAGYEDIKTRVKEAIELIGGFEPKGMVVIKPNAGSPLTPKRAANTHHAVVSAVVELTRDYASEVIVVESEAIAAPADVCLKKSGIEEAVLKSGGRAQNPG